MAYGWRLEARYANGFVYTENDADLSPFDPTHNCWYDIAQGVPTQMGHGAMVELSLIGPEITYSFDWTELPADTTPIHEMDVEMMIIQGGPDDGAQLDPVCVRRRFGWSYVDDYGNTATHTVTIHGGPTAPQVAETN